MEKAHKALKVYSEAMELAKAAYKETAKLPEEEKFGLISQMRRCAVSVLSNIAEGAARHGNKEGLQFFNIARGSVSELDAQIELCTELGYFDISTAKLLTTKLDRVESLLSGLIRYRKEGAKR
jgi:four helix bundle protein